jgi:hypothetical protein
MHLLQDLQRATNNNIEHQSLDYIRYTLRPWAIRLEQEINSKLLGLDSGFYCEHDFNAFQRGDFASQTAGYNLLRNAGVYSADDILKKLRENPIGEENGGHIRIVPVNMVPLTSMLHGKAADPDAPTTDSQGGTPITDAKRGPVIQAYRKLFRDAVGRTVKRNSAEPKWIAQTFAPILGSMAVTMLTLAVGGAAKLSDDDEAAVRQHADKVANAASKWTAENASEAATDLTEEAYTALQAALTGAR